ncbi:divalent-cation tolerance protein CutA [Patescibacteria group bacterium]|nr:divalent-cation tolerance protein CutA [Patescibacteria group bacterium]
MDFVFVYITNPTKREARKIAKHLLKKKLIACANIFPINSLYWWEGKIIDDNEFVLIAKTTKANFKKVKKEVEKVHSYKIPCIVKIPVSSNKKYFNWLKREIKK